MRRKKIVHFFVNSYEIGKGLSVEFPEFQLTYKGEGLSDNVCVIKGGVMNIGKKDVDGLKGKSDITMNLVQDCNVRALKVQPSNGQLCIHADFNGNKIDFGINELFVSDEYFEYTAIVENIDTPQSIKFSHRIKDTKKEIENIVVGPDFIEKDTGALKSLSLYIGFFGIPSALFLLSYFEEGKVAYVILFAVFLMLLLLSFYFVIFKENDKRHVITVLRNTQKESRKK